MRTVSDNDIMGLLEDCPFDIQIYSNDDLILFRRALTHHTYMKEMQDADHSFNGEDYQRLEFLGDSILGFIIGNYAYHKEELMNEGMMTEYRIDLINNFNLSHALQSKYPEIDDRIQIGNNVRITEHIRSDIFESLLGAIYLTYGWKKLQMLYTGY